MTLPRSIPGSPTMNARRLRSLRTRRPPPRRLRRSRIRRRMVRHLERLRRRPDGVQPRGGGLGAGRGMDRGGGPLHRGHRRRSGAPVRPHQRRGRGRQGNVYVADLQSLRHPRVRRRGTYLRTIGRPGSGPGEIGRGLTGVFVVGDTVLAPISATSGLPDSSVRRLHRQPAARFRRRGAHPLGRGRRRADRHPEARPESRRYLAAPHGDAIVTLPAAEGRWIPSR